MSYYAVWHFFKHEGISFKKSLHASEQDRPDVARRRIGQLLDQFTAEECAAYLNHAGYASK